MPKRPTPDSTAPRAKSTAPKRPRHRRAAFWRRVLLLLTAAALLWLGREPLCEAAKWQAQRAIRVGRPEVALDWLTCADILSARDAEVAFLKARGYRKLGRFDETRAALIRSGKLGYPVERLEREQWLALAQAGQLREAEPHLAGLLTDPGGDASEICEAYVTGFIRNHRVGEAFLLLDSWAADEPDNPLPEVLRGKLQIELGRWEDAEKSLARASALRPGDTEADYYLANVLVERKRTREALPVYERCAVQAADPTELRRAKIGQVRCLRTLGDAERARSLLERMLRKEPGERDALIELARVEMEAGRFAEAVADLEQADARRDHDLEVRYAWAGALRGAGRLEEARKEFEEIAQAQSSLTRAANLLDRVRKKPDDVEARFEAGRTFLRYGEPEKGLFWLRSVLDYAPDHGPTCRLLAEYYERRSAEDRRFAALAHEYRRRAGAG
jgi:tetratricopeptide (TPR) repeat protein